MNNQEEIIKKQIGKYTITIIRNKCISATSCAAISPGVFEMDEKNLVKFTEKPKDLPEYIVMAAQSCPTKAIIIMDTETGKQVWPQ
jgi:ferredoxin